MSLAQELVNAWNSGRVCLHPTDSIPGLSINPLDPKAWQALKAIKSRDNSKSYISLVADRNTAVSLWKPLPSFWALALGRLWPGPISVIWQASPLAPQQLVRDDGTIALRVPRFNPPIAWLSETLNILKIMPTTSVNDPGRTPALTWFAALNFAQKHPDIFIPNDEDLKLRNFSQQPSALIRITGEKSYEIIRTGVYGLEELREAIS